jgi:hypothetical protein
MRTLSRQRTMLLGMLGVISLLVLSRIAPAGAQAPAPEPACTAASLHGSYAYSRMGTIVGIGPTAANGVVTFDGQSRLTGTDTASVNGEIIQRMFEGDYQITATCTGAATLVFTDGESVSLDLQLVASGETVSFIQTNEGTVITGSAQKMIWDFTGVAEQTSLSRTSEGTVIDNDYLACFNECTRGYGGNFHRVIFCRGACAIQ